MTLVSKQLTRAPEIPLIQHLRWNTAITKAGDNSETRRALLSKPREVYEATWRLDDAQMRRRRADLYRQTDTDWKLPLWHDPYLTTGAASSGGSTVAGDFTDHDLVAGMQVYISDDDQGDGEFQVVSSVTGSTTLAIVGTWGRNYAAGSRVYPARTVRHLRDGLAIVRQPINLGDLRLVLDSTEFYTLGGAGASLTTYQTLPVLDQQPIMRGGASEAFRRPVFVTDFGIVPYETAVSSIADIAMPRSYRAGSRTDRQWWKLFLDTVLGQCEPFYAPTWTPDLDLTSQPGASATAITVNTDETDFETEWYTPSGTHQDIAVKTDTDGWIYRRVTSITDNLDGTKDLHLDSALPSSSGLQVERLSFLEMCRLASDEVTFEHRPTYSVVNATLQVIEQ